MNILCYAFEGRGSNPILGAIMVFFAILCAFWFVLCKKEVWMFISGFVFSVTLFFSIFSFIDFRIPIVKATINETVPWKEIDNKYTFLAREGDIYTFAVKDMDIEEWENLINNDGGLK